MNKFNTKITALGGILTAAAVALMFFGSVIPFATYSVPAMASMCVLYMVIEFQNKVAFIVYLAISLLSGLLVPDKEIAMMFIFFFGYFPIVKAVFEKKFSRPVALLFKFIVFNISVSLAYLIMTKIFVVESVLMEFKSYTILFMVALLVLGNIMLFFFDLALTKIVWYYLYNLRNKLIKN